MRKLSLFSGIAGIDLAAHWAGMKTVAFCEREPFPQKVLRKHWPNVPIYDDVCTLTAERLREDGIIGPGRTIDIISGGYPCQPFSHAGKRQGKEDDRHLWPEVYRLLQEIRPRWFVGENVAGHVTLGLDDVLSNLGDIGYTAQTFIIPAAAVGAPHRRDRVFIVGYTTSPGFQEWRQSGFTEESEETGAGVESESERSSENVAYSEGILERRLSIGARTQNTGFTCSCEDVAYTKSKRSGEEREHQYGRPEERTSGGCEALAYSSSPGREELNISSFTNRQRHRPGSDNEINVADTNSESGLEACSSTNSVRSLREPRNNACRCSRKQSTGINWGAIESQLGGVLDGLSDWLDRYKWPAGQGAEQYDWEPPRVAIGVRDRVGRLKALGNAVSPIQIYPIMAAIKAIDDQIVNA
ncbi:MAG: DNA (cytosine-5-)-methyltransferase [Paenibacillaceae bacterium]|nr:DNA (cytosine-5-)-methyltransferase [Paenibacillaceae bacterium]